MDEATEDDERTDEQPVHALLPPSLAGQPVLELGSGLFRALGLLHPAQTVGDAMNVNVDTNALALIPGMGEEEMSLRGDEEAKENKRGTIFGPTPGKAVMSLKVEGMSPSYLSRRMRVEFFMYWT